MSSYINTASFSIQRNNRFVHAHPPPLKPTLSPTTHLHPPTSPLPNPDNSNNKPPPPHPHLPPRPPILPSNLRLTLLQHSLHHIHHLRHTKHILRRPIQNLQPTTPNPDIDRLSAAGVAAPGDAFFVVGGAGEEGDDAETGEEGDGGGAVAGGVACWGARSG